MEYLKLFVELVEAVAWPVSILIIVIIIRPSISQLLLSFKDANNIELELGGQKLKVDRLGESMRQTIKTGIEKSKISAPEEVEEYIYEQASLLKELSFLSRNEFSVLGFINTNPGIHTMGNAKALTGYLDKFEPEYSAVRKVLISLLEKELVEREMVKGSYRYTCTEKGTKLLEMAVAYEGNS